MQKSTSVSKDTAGWNLIYTRGRAGSESPPSQPLAKEKWGCPAPQLAACSPGFCSPGGVLKEHGEHSW